MGALAAGMYSGVGTPGALDRNVSLRLIGPWPIQDAPAPWAGRPGAAIRPARAPSYSITILIFRVGAIWVVSNKAERLDY